MKGNVVGRAVSSPNKHFPTSSFILPVNFAALRRSEGLGPMNKLIGGVMRNRSWKPYRNE